MTETNFFECYVDFFELVNDVKLRVLKYLEIPEELNHYFGFYEEIESENYFEETFINDSVKITDILASWEFDMNMNGKRIIERPE